MIYNIHNFRIKVPAWALLLVVLIAVGLAAMGDLTSFGAGILINTIFTKAVPAMLTVCAAVFYSPTSNNIPGADPEPVTTEHESGPTKIPAPIAAPEAAA